MTAAVNPDAFSDGAAVKIGKSVFYNQRINTTGSGLVQVLLVDGSTFTVGPGSDLVIDKFVYDPKKNKGEIVATFCKGVMRFVGGKFSKNDGGVTVNTPSGASPFAAAWPTSAEICSPSSTATNSSIGTTQRHGAPRLLQ